MANPMSIKPRFLAKVTRPAVNGSSAVEFSTEVIGREAWALLALIAAGSRGCTPINRPAPRWSDYVFRLRGKGVHVETVDVDHGGAYAGQHACYILRDRVHVYGGNLDAFLAAPEGREFAGVDFSRVTA